MVTRVTRSKTPYFHIKIKKIHGYLVVTRWLPVGYPSKTELFHLVFARNKVLTLFMKIQFIVCVS